MWIKRIGFALYLIIIILATVSSFNGRSFVVIWIQNLGNQELNYNYGKVTDTWSCCSKVQTSGTVVAAQVVLFYGVGSEVRN